jgi:uncharacterized surface protein with fasciclin (FAS1) repeats
MPAVCWVPERKSYMRSTLIIAAVGSALALTACGKPADNRSAATPGATRDAAGDQTIVSGLGADDSKFADAAKAVGLDATLAGPGPYTVLVPTNAAFDKLPAGTLDTLLKPGSRAELTKLLTGHILPGAILASDIGKAIDNGKGKATLATFGGGTLTAVRDGGKIVLSDNGGGKATIGTSDDKRSNGVVHHLDGVLMPR